MNGWIHQEMMSLRKPSLAFQFTLRIYTSEYIPNGESVDDWSFSINTSINYNLCNKQESYYNYVLSYNSYLSGKILAPLFPHPSLFSVKQPSLQELSPHSPNL